MNSSDYEKLGEFYLGRPWSLAEDTAEDELLLYDSKDLTTHAVCVGMTGSGKTGLCLSLIEEAAIDGVPVIAIDPKGDLSNLLLAFPDLQASDFAEWVDPAEATRNGQAPEAYAEGVARQWQNGLSEWGQGPERVARFRDAAEVRIYTPGSSAGLPLSVLGSFAAPPEEVRSDPEAMAELAQSAVSGLLGLLGIDTDPLASPEHLLLSNILTASWEQGRDLDLVGLIRAIQRPPFDQVGVFDLESFFPAKERTALAMRVNALVASPRFRSWTQGEALDVQGLLHAPGGKPRISICSIAHLNDEERMFFVTLLLNAVVSWMRRQSGTSSLRALVYMDEIFGFFPPTAKPPSKQPMMTLLKQARAFGVGVVLATQNPADLDYKGLSNAGTWFIGRLQTERDKLRVLEGLDGASAASGGDYDRAAMERTLSGLGSRVFLLNNVHDDGPVVFHTRWLLSYLRGPMTRTEIQRLMAPYRMTASDEKPATKAPSSPGRSERPVVAAGIAEQFLTPRPGPLESGPLTYRPGLMSEVQLHYVRASKGIDIWKSATCVASFTEDGALDWAEGEFLSSPPDSQPDPAPQATYEALPTACSSKRSYASWRKALRDDLYRTREMRILECKALKMSSLPGEGEAAFRGRLAHALREKRDMEVEKLKRRYSAKFKSLQDRMRRVHARVMKEQSQYESARTRSIADIGSSILGAVFGRRTRSATQVSSMVRDTQRISREQQDVERAQDDLDALQASFTELEREFQDAVRDLQDTLAVDSLELADVVIRPRKSDIQVDTPLLVWTPSRVDSGASA